MEQQQEEEVAGRVIFGGGGALALGLLLAAPTCGRPSPNVQAAGAPARVAEVAAAPAVVSGASAPADELAALREQLAARDAEIRRLKHELGIEQQRRYDREVTWLEYNRWLARLPLGEQGKNLVFPLDPSLIPPESQPSFAPASKPAPAPPAPEAVRAGELASRMNALLWSDGIRDLSVLDGGRVGPDLEHPAWIGPVLLRRVDGDGRLAGSLVADRMRLECSRAARTVTIVLEGGYEQVDGARTEFEPIGRRILLPLVDPDRWLEGCPDLFAADQQLSRRDDGLWDKPRVRAALNRLLAEDAAHGYWQVKDIGGIRGAELRDVQLLALDRAGRMQRLAFCDTLTLRASASGVELALRDGAVVRDGRKAPFPEGRMRIVLPHASAAEFAAARIPGFAEPDLLPGVAADAEAAAPAAADEAQR
ncbi:MAG: hypothetical protein EPO68_04590 [Planctomycetota bacterium]|nr:MAG: hypothetical protein EPO68_04590 [Planctomycetota bacterium]